MIAASYSDARLVSITVSSTAGMDEDTDAHGMDVSEAWTLFELPEDATFSDVRAAYKKLARDSHTDKSSLSQADATRAFQRIQAAYSALKRHYGEDDGSDDSDDDDDDGFESDEGSAPTSTTLSPSTSVWERMAGNISKTQLDTDHVVQLIIDGMRTEQGRARHGDVSIKIKGTAPDWKELARGALQRATHPMSNDAFERRCAASTKRAQGCEVLVWLSRESDDKKHGHICRDEVFNGVDGSFYDRDTLSEYELAMHFMLSHADDIVVIMQAKKVDGYMYWRRGAWIHETEGSSLLASDVQDASHELLNGLHEHHAKKLQDFKDTDDDDATGDNDGKSKTKTIKAMERKVNNARVAMARHGNLQNRNVVQLVLNMKKRMAVTSAEDPFDTAARGLLPFTNGVVDLKTHAFRDIRKDDYILRTTGKEWQPPTEQQVNTMRGLFESMLPVEGPRKTVYSMLRLCLSAEAAEKFWMLTGSGRNGKGLVMRWMSFLLGDELFSDGMPMGMLTSPLTGTGASPENRKAHRRRVLNWSEPPEKDDDDAYDKKARKQGLSILLTNIKTITGEATISARDCSSNDSRCELWGTAVLQCNSHPKIIGTIDDSAIERIVMIEFPFTFTADEYKLRNNPSKYKALDTKLKSDAFMKEHYCALVQLLLEECSYDTVFIAPECKQAASVYLGKQDQLQTFLAEQCIREETAPVRQWLGVKEMLARYNDEMSNKLKERDLKEKLKNHRATNTDYKEKGEAVLSDRPLRRNTAIGLLNWRLKSPDQEAGTSERDSKRPRVE